jgi:hypothetical protein
MRKRKRRRKRDRQRAGIPVARAKAPFKECSIIRARKSERSSSIRRDNRILTSRPPFIFPQATPASPPRPSLPPLNTRLSMLGTHTYLSAFIMRSSMLRCPLLSRALVAHASELVFANISGMTARVITRFRANRALSFHSSAVRSPRTYVSARACDIAIAFLRIARARRLTRGTAARECLK